MNSANKKYDLISLGSCTMDMIVSVEDVVRMELTDKHLSDKKYLAIEHSSKLNVNKLKFHPGGSAANIACDLSSIGFRTAYIGGVGNDQNGKTCLEDMKNHGVDVTGVEIFEEESTAISVIIQSPWGRDSSILAYKGANNLYSASNIIDNMLLSTKCFVWTSLTSDDGIEAIKKCIKLTKSKNGLIAGAPSISIIKNRSEEAISLLEKSDITSLNEEEVLALTGETDILKAMRFLFNLGLRIVNITFGKDGQWLSDGKVIVKTTPPKVFPADTTGAGDATFSGIIYGVLNEKSLEESAKIAVSLSAMEIESPGVRVGTPISYAELEHFMNSHPIAQQTVDF